MLRLSTEQVEGIARRVDFTRVEKAGRAPTCPEAQS